MIAFDITTIVKALKEAETMIATIKHDEGELSDDAIEWLGRNEAQAALVAKMPAVVKDLPKFGELQAWARWTAEEINAILKTHGFEIRLNPWPNDRRTFGVAAIYDLILKWLMKGDNSFKIHDKPAFRLAASKAGVRFYDAGSLLISIMTETDDIVYIAPAKRTPSTVFELYEIIEHLRAKRTNARPVHRWGGLVLPNVCFDQEVDLTWLIGLAAGNWSVSQAKMQAKFALGPKGARARVATAMSVTRTFGVEKVEDYVVDHDFILWVEREGVKSTPLFSAFVSLDEFADREVDIDE